MNISLTIHSDSEGYITYECPYCKMAFKLAASDINDETFPIRELFCPYCGLTDSISQFISSKAKEALQIKAMNQTIEMLNSQLSNMTKGINRKKGIIKMNFKPMKQMEEKEVEDDESIDEILNCSICDHSFKAIDSTGASKLYCPYCGVDL